jgi:hypothetical protein
MLETEKATEAGNFGSPDNFQLLDYRTPAALAKVLRARLP